MFRQLSPTDLRMGAPSDIAVVESEEMFLSADLDTMAKLDEENKEVRKNVYILLELFRFSENLTKIDYFYTNSIFRRQRNIIF